MIQFPVYNINVGPNLYGLHESLSKTQIIRANYHGDTYFKAQTYKTPSRCSFFFFTKGPKHSKK